jgi:phosphoglycolate phosphatase-like HAD superfamily hydrolase
MGNRVKLIIFDFDGTLVDSRSLILESHRIVFSEFRLPVPSSGGQSCFGRQDTRFNSGTTGRLDSADPRYGDSL